MHQAEYNAHYSASLGRLYSGCLQQQYSMNSNPYQLWSATIVNDVIYMFGGIGGGPEGRFDQVMCYDPVAAAWRKLQATGKLPAARNRHACAAIGDLIYVFGGEGEFDKETAEALGSGGAANIMTRKIFGDAFTFCTSTNSWSELPVKGLPMLESSPVVNSQPTLATPIPRRGHTMNAYTAAHHDRPQLIVFGGLGFSPNGESMQNDVWVFDPTSGVWASPNVAYAQPEGLDVQSAEEHEFDQKSISINQTSKATHRIAHRNAASDERDTSTPDGHGKLLSLEELPTQERLDLQDIVKQAQSRHTTFDSAGCIQAALLLSHCDSLDSLASLLLSADARCPSRCPSPNDNPQHGSALNSMSTITSIQTQHGAATMMHGPKARTTRTGRHAEGGGGLDTGFGSGGPGDMRRKGTSSTTRTSRIRTSRHNLTSGRVTTRGTVVIPADDSGQPVVQPADADPLANVPVVHGEEYDVDAGCVAYNALSSRAVISGSPPVPRCNHSAIILHDSLWVYGGTSAMGVLSDLYALDLMTYTWSHIADTFGPSPGPVFLHGMTADPWDTGAFFIFGGRTGGTHEESLRMAEEVAHGGVRFNDGPAQAGRVGSGSMLSRKKSRGRATASGFQLSAATAAMGAGSDIGAVQAMRQRLLQQAAPGQARSRHDSSFPSISSSHFSAESGQAGVTSAQEPRPHAANVFHFSSRQNRWTASAPTAEGFVPIAIGAGVPGSGIPVPSLRARQQAKYMQHHGRPNDAHVSGNDATVGGGVHEKGEISTGLWGRLGDERCRVDSKDATPSPRFSHVMLTLHPSTTQQRLDQLRKIRQRAERRVKFTGSPQHNGATEPSASANENTAETPPGRPHLSIIPSPASSPHGGSALSPTRASRRTQGSASSPSCQRVSFDQSVSSGASAVSFEEPSFVTSPGSSPAYPSSASRRLHAAGTEEQMDHMHPFLRIHDQATDKDMMKQVYPTRQHQIGNLLTRLKHTHRHCEAGCSGHGHIHLDGYNRRADEILQQRLHEVMKRQDPTYIKQWVGAQAGRVKSGRHGNVGGRSKDTGGWFMGVYDPTPAQRAWLEREVMFRRIVVLGGVRGQDREGGSGVGVGGSQAPGGYCSMDLAHYLCLLPPDLPDLLFQDLTPSLQTDSKSQEQPERTAPSSTQISPPSPSQGLSADATLDVNAHASRHRALEPSHTRLPSIDRSPIRIRPGGGGVAYSTASQHTSGMFSQGGATHTIAAKVVPQTQIRTAGEMEADHLAQYERPALVKPKGFSQSRWNTMQEQIWPEYAVPADPRPQFNYQGSSSNHVSTRASHTSQANTSHTLISAGERLASGKFVTAAMAKALLEGDDYCNDQQAQAQVWQDMHGQGQGQGPGGHRRGRRQGGGRGHRGQSLSPSPDRYAGSVTVGDALVMSLQKFERKKRFGRMVGMLGLPEDVNEPVVPAHEKVKHLSVMAPPTAHDGSSEQSGKAHRHQSTPHPGMESVWSRHQPAAHCGGGGGKGRQPYSTPAISEGRADGSVAMTVAAARQGVKAMGSGGYGSGQGGGIGQPMPKTSMRGVKQRFQASFDPAKSPLIAGVENMSASAHKYGTKRSMPDVSPQRTGGGMANSELGDGGSMGGGTGMSTGVGSGMFSPLLGIEQQKAQRRKLAESRHGAARRPKQYRAMAV